MKIKEIKVTDVLKFSWKSIVFFFQMIAGIIVGSFELYTSALNSVFIVVVEKIIGFLCFCGIIYGLYLFGEYGKGKPAPFELSYGELVTYLFFLYIVATLFLLISKIQKNTELLEKILPKENSHRTVQEIENRREVVGFLFLKKMIRKKLAIQKMGSKN
jgi:large-conductance mechanosensitive channel